jgi:hypothetical protein
MVSLQIGKDEMGEDAEKKTEYAIKQVGDRYYPLIIDREAGGHYEINTPLTGGILSYNNPEAAESYIKRARERKSKGSRGITPLPLKRNHSPPERHIANTRVDRYILDALSSRLLSVAASCAPYRQGRGRGE